MRERARVGGESALTPIVNRIYLPVEKVRAALAARGEDGMDFGEFLRWLFSEAGAG